MRKRNCGRMNRCASVILPEVVGVRRIAAATAVGVGPAYGVEAVDPEVGRESRVQVHAQLVLVEYRFGEILIDNSQRGIGARAGESCCCRRERFRADKRSESRTTI